MARHQSLLRVAVAAALAWGCGERAPGPRVSPADAAPQAAARSASPPRPGPADRAVSELRAAALKRLASDRAVASNALGYEQALARQEAAREGTGMAAHLPRGPIDAAALEATLRRLARDEGLLVVALEIGPEVPAAPVPAEHRGAGPYAYSDAQLFATRPLTLTLGGATEAALGRYYAAVVAAGVPLPVFEARERSAAGVILRGLLYRESDAAPPRHLVPPVDRAALAAAAGVTVPVGHPRLAEVDALLAQRAALSPKLEAAMAALGRSHLAAARLRFYRELTERLQARPLPVPPSAQQERKTR